MPNVTVEVPQELIDQLGQSGLAGDDSNRVRVALAIHLFVSGQATLGRAAELAGFGLVDFQELLLRLDLPTVVYDRDEYERDQKAADQLRARLSIDRGR